MILLLTCWLILSTNHSTTLNRSSSAEAAGIKSVSVSGDTKGKASATADKTQTARVRSIVFVPTKKPLFTPAEMIGGGLAITYGLFETDDEVYEKLHGIRMRSAVLSTVSPVVSMMGLGTFSVALFGGFYAYHYVTGDETSLQAANLGMETFVFSGISTQILKNMFGRERPSMRTKEGGRWSGPLSYFEHRDKGSKSIASYDAFPSGHTATIFAAASTIADTYHESWVPYVAYGTATIVGISRVMESAHWPSDVFVGAIIGIGSTKIVENLPFNEHRARIRLGVVDKNSVGATLSMDF